MPLTSDQDIRELLTNARTIAMVGASDRPDRPSYGVMAMLQRHGYRVIPVNPQITGEHVGTHSCHAIRGFRVRIRNVCDVGNTR